MLLGSIVINFSPFSFFCFRFHVSRDGVVCLV